MRQSQVPPQGKFKVKSPEKKELYLSAYVEKDGSYLIHRRMYPADQFFRDSILKLDYSYTPWPRCGGNLLWN